MSTFVLCLNTEQKVDTVEHGVVRGLAVVTSDACENQASAQDFATIAEGDEIIGASTEGIRWIASVDEILEATASEESESLSGEKVRILKGKLTARGSRSIAAVCKKLKDDEIALPGIFNARGSGFKHGAVATKLTDEQSEELKNGLN